MSAPIEVRPLTPALLDDYLGFFDGPAFSDNPHWASCYCYFHHNPDPDSWGTRTGVENREDVSGLIRRDRFHGFLAYAGEAAIGWCNAAPRRDIPALARSPELAAPDADHVGSIVCFVVAAEHRRAGVATALLRAALTSFSAAGLTIAEAYPRTGALTDASNYHGPVELYRAEGFRSVREFDGWSVVRKML
jgi:ribosomal protein S18 acetylase RimI-like enzyme